MSKRERGVKGGGGSEKRGKKGMEIGSVGGEAQSKWGGAEEY